MAGLKIELPPEFTLKHENAVINYLSDNLRGREDWRQAFAAFDLLDNAVLVDENGRHAFRSLYMEIVDLNLADSYIQSLLALANITKESPALWSRYARYIVSECQRRGWQQANLPGARILVSYLLYWWGAFARGYAFEVEIFRDLHQSGIVFEAHDLLDRQSRYSVSDLVVHRMTGDIKTSVYFVQAATPVQHDFYIVRLFSQGRPYTLSVMLQLPAWDEINGDTIEGTLETAVAKFPHPVKIRQGIHELVALDYDQWKQRILRLQGGS
jgi:hypothetical protein